MPVYFLLDETTKDLRLKIGFSAKPDARVGVHQASSGQELSLLGVLPGARDAERHFHQLLGDQRYRGEWFRVSQDQVDVIRDFFDAYEEECLTILLEQSLKHVRARKHEAERKVT